MGGERREIVAKLREAAALDTAEELAQEHGREANGVLDGIRREKRKTER